MSAAWPTVRLGELLRRSEEILVPMPEREYREITVRLWGRGVIERGRVDGARLVGSRRYCARSGQFIISRIDARNGAVGIVPDALDGAVVTNDFPLYDVHTDRFSSSYLKWLSRTRGFIELCRRASEGTTNRVRLNEDRFLAIHISLPSLAEQQKIVARIEEVAVEVHEASGLRRRALEETSALIGSRSGVKFTTLAKTFPVHPLGQLASHIVDGPHQTPHYLPDGVPGVPFITVKNMVTGTLSFADLNYVSNEDHRLFSRRCKAEQGDVLYSKDGATRGRPCLVTTNQEFSYFVSVALIKPLRDRLDGRYLVHLLSSNWTRTE